MKRTLLILTVLISAFVGGILGVLFAVRYLELTPTYTSISDHQNTLVNYRNDSTRLDVGNGQFERAAQIVTPAVVHIRAIYGPGYFSLNPLEHGNHPQMQSTGSGVILTNDGFIATNFHVIDGAQSVEIVMNNNQRFFAKVVGTDPSTDLALLKIKARNLPFVKYGDSDHVTTGEWVLAIGNPFDLNSTVTAGIISAKARNIHILQARNNLAVESFIQTDAAVNPGNSGGALVNLNGELIGINSAIATATGSFSGYSFAIPVSLVRKVMDDLLEFGQVQRGILGIVIDDVTADVAEDLNLDVVQGVMIRKVNDRSAAEKAGMKTGDVITAVDEHRVGSVSELQEWVARKRPGQQVIITLRRNAKEIKLKTLLKTFEGVEGVVAKEVLNEIEGATLEELSPERAEQLHVQGGVVLKNLVDGRWKKAGLMSNFVIVFIDKVPVETVTDLNRILELKHGGILVEGFNPEGKKSVVGVDWE